MVRYLTPLEIYTINEDSVGYQPMVRDHHLLRVAIARPLNGAFGQEAYPTLIDKAAALLHSLAAHHPFIDGNKRTAHRAVILFLELNDITPKWTDDEGYAFILEIAQSQHDVESIAEWLNEHVEASTLE